MAPHPVKLPSTFIKQSDDSTTQPQTPQSISDPVKPKIVQPVKGGDGMMLPVEKVTEIIVMLNVVIQDKSKPLLPLQSKLQ
jgi:hypothetical protein